MELRSTLNSAQEGFTNGLNRVVNFAGDHPKTSYIGGGVVAGALAYKLFTVVNGRRAASTNNDCSSSATKADCIFKRTLAALRAVPAKVGKASKRVWKVICTPFAKVRNLFSSYCKKGVATTAEPKAALETPAVALLSVKQAEAALEAAKATLEQAKKPVVPADNRYWARFRSELKPAVNKVAVKAAEAAVAEAAAVLEAAKASEASESKPEASVEVKPEALVAAAEAESKTDESSASDSEGAAE